MYMYVKTCAFGQPEHIIGFSYFMQHTVYMTQDQGAESSVLPFNNIVNCRRSDELRSHCHLYSYYVMMYM